MITFSLKKQIQTALFLYLFYMPWAGYAQTPIFKLEGTITDVNTREPLKGFPVKLIHLERSDTLITRADSNGFYRIEKDEAGKRLFRANADYLILLDDFSYRLDGRCGYLSARGTKSTKGINESTAFIKDFRLQSFNCCNLEIVMPHIHFHDCHTFLEPEQHSYVDSLRYIYDVLLENPTVIIEISAHATGRATEELNKECSRTRGEATAKYLVSLGIDRERWVVAAYRSDRPMFTEAQIATFNEEEKRRAHLLNNRVVFTTLSYDYVPGKDNQ